MKDVELIASKNYIFMDKPGSPKVIPDGAPQSMKGEECASVPGALTMEIIPCEIFEFHFNS